MRGYGTLDPAVLSSAISAAGGIASSGVEAIGGVEVAKIQKAAQEKAEKAALEASRQTVRTAPASARKSRDKGSFYWVAGPLLLLGAAGVVWYVARRRRS